MARIAIITGAASGIGRALAGALAARGDTVVLADIDGDGADRAARAPIWPGKGRARRRPRRWTSATPQRSRPWWTAPGNGSAGWT